MPPHPTILFICTGNIFRSMTAEYALRAALGATASYDVRSAGLAEPSHGIVDFVADYMAHKGLAVSAHRPTRLTEALLDQAALAVAMGIEHRDQIGQAFGRRLPLFSEIAYGTIEPLRDVWEVVPDWRRNRAAGEAYGHWVMDYIFDGMPGFVQRMHLFLQVSQT